MTQQGSFHKSESDPKSQAAGPKTRGRAVLGMLRPWMGFGGAHDSKPAPALPPKGGVPVGLGTPPLGGSEEFCRAPVSGSPPPLPTNFDRRPFSSPKGPAGFRVLKSPVSGRDRIVANRAKNLCEILVVKPVAFSYLWPAEHRFWCEGRPVLPSSDAELDRKR